MRQLKNVVEQLALFEAGTEISRHTLMGTLPEDRSPLATPAVAQPSGQSYEAERQLLWQMVMSMRRELDELHDRAPVVAEPTDVLAESVGSPIPRARSLIRAAEAAPDTATTLEAAERDAVVAALERNHGDKKRAAEELNISSRTLYRKIKEYGLQNL